MFLILGCETEMNQYQKVNLDRAWKFKTGDNLQYSASDFNDSDWEEIRVNQTWNKQGYKKYEGFAWYRIHVVIPASLKENPFPNDSLIFNFGKIDDFNQFFLNGQLVGENLNTLTSEKKVTDDFKNLKESYWDVPRRYSLSIDNPLIKWDKENVIAIRVFDWGVAGGIYSGGLNITTPKFSDYLKIVPEKDGDENIRKVSLQNGSKSYEIQGAFTIEVFNNISDKKSYERKYQIKINPGESRAFSFRFEKPRESTTIKYRFNFDGENYSSTFSEGVKYILTPPEKDAPQINGALIYGERSGKPFLYKIAASGKRPMKFYAEGLPKGLVLDSENGIISGAVKTKGKYPVLLKAENDFGSDSKTLEIVIGDKLLLTPPMGWNSWNCWGLSVSQQKVYDAAKSFVESGLANHGWTYINVDDGWSIFGKSKERKRKSNGEIRTNEKFPDMKKLGKDIHALGLKFGIYSSPGPLTCGKYTASYKHEFQDAKTFAKWGIDYLKYDLCTYRKLMKDVHSVKELIPPYKLMHKALTNNLSRDIAYSICEYGLGKVWEWGDKVGGQLWRTTGDIWDDWDRMYEIGFGNIEAAEYSGPGHWNDLDMLIVGWVGWGPNLHETRLTPDEQYTHVSLWALRSAPLLLGNDLTKLDEFTLNLITNDEVIAIDQDKLGQEATPVIKKEGIEVWMKNLSDGNKAIGIFNVSAENRNFTLPLSELGFKDSVLIRDIWREKNIGKFAGMYKTRIASHGVQLIKIFIGK